MVVVAHNPVEDSLADAAWVQGDVSSVEGVRQMAARVAMAVDLVIELDAVRQRSRCSPVSSPLI